MKSFVNFSAQRNASDGRRCAIFPCMVPMVEIIRHIVHLDVPDFCAALEQLRRPELNRRPLALAEPGTRSIIQGVNAASRSEGVQEGMPLARARRLCRRIEVVPPDLLFYKQQHRRIVQDLIRFSPRVEGTLPGRYFIDLTGTGRLWGAPSDMACRVEERLAEDMRLQGRVGLGGNKLISQVAANSVTTGDLCHVFPGGETSFLGPLPVRLLPGVGFKTALRLADFNIQQVGQLAGISPGDLSVVFGSMGNRLARLAQGFDPTPVVPFQETPRLSLVRNLDRREMDRERLEAFLFQQVEEAGWALRRHNRYPGRAVLDVRYADGVTAQVRRKLSPAAAHVDRRLFSVMRPALHQLMERRVAFRRMVLELSRFTMPFRQRSLFSWEEPEAGRDGDLQGALDEARRRFGRNALFWGRAFASDPEKAEITDASPRDLEITFRF